MFMDELSRVTEGIQDSEHPDEEDALIAVISGPIGWDQHHEDIVLLPQVIPLLSRINGRFRGQ